MKHKNTNHIHRTVGGKTIDMNKLRNMNSTMRAVGNAKLNARGDKLDSKGTVKRKREDIVNDYYSKKQEGIRYVSLTDVTNKQIIPQNPPAAAVQHQPQEMNFITPSDIRRNMDNSNNLDAPKNVARKKPNRNLTDEE